MPIGPMTRRWLIVIVAALVVILVGVWLYTAYAAGEVEPEVADDEVSLSAAIAPPVQPRPRPILR